MCNEYVDRIWLMPMYTHVKEYISAITKKPVSICPYVWDSELIDIYIKNTKIDSVYKHIENDSGLHILIMEPNMSIHKNALPLYYVLLIVIL